MNDVEDSSIESKQWLVLIAMTAAFLIFIYNYFILREGTLFLVSAVVLVAIPIIWRVYAFTKYPGAFKDTDRTIIPGFLCIVGIFWPLIIMVLLMNHVLPDPPSGIIFLLFLLGHGILLSIAAFLSARKSLRIESINYPKAVLYALTKIDDLALLAGQVPLPDESIITFRKDANAIAKNGNMSIGTGLLLMALGFSVLSATLFMILIIIIGLV